MDKYIHSWMKKSYIILNLWPSSVFRQNIETISLLLISFTSCHTLCYLSEFMPIYYDVVTCNKYSFRVGNNYRHLQQFFSYFETPKLFEGGKSWEVLISGRWQLVSGLLNTSGGYLIRLKPISVVLGYWSSINHL